MSDTRTVMSSNDGRNYEVPAHWSENAALIFVKKYCRSYNNKFLETSVEQVFRRLVNFWCKNTKRRETLFDDLWQQRASPNSPQYFNAGIHKAYGVKGGSIGLWYLDGIKDDRTQAVEFLSDYTYVHPQLHACFIQPVNDSLIDITSLLTKEARLFSRGSGTGTNFSTLRGRDEKIRGGGGSSGLISFLKAFDALAGAIKSGGTTRRAAKMVILDVDHPDIEEFIDWKSREEEKAHDLIKTGKYGNDWQSEAYQTVSGQNSNNSVSVPDSFMLAVENDDDWQLVGRVDKSANRTVKAKKLWDKICKAAWFCADPGVQFTDTINSWNTTPHRGRIRASNPCSEHLRLDDSACNLASINLCKFIVDNKFDCPAFVETVKRWVNVLDRSVDLAGYPARHIAYNACRFRDIGLGYCNLGAMLMRLLIPYGSAEGRIVASLVTSLMTGAAHVQSALLAKESGPYYHYSRDDHLGIVYRHHNEFTSVAEDDYPDTELMRGLLEACSSIWDRAIALSEEHGLRNAQLTVIAPTGTIGITMDAETTGIEPLFSTMASKTLAGGGQLYQASESFSIAQRRLGIGKGQLTNDLMQNPVFAVAVDGAHGNELTPDDHVNMLAAVQPHVSGGISKTVNLPRKATVGDIDRIYRRAHALGVKCIAVYRDGSKSQPLSPAECRTCGDDDGVCDLAPASGD